MAEANESLSPGHRRVAFDEGIDDAAGCNEPTEPAWKVRFTLNRPLTVTGAIALFTPELPEIRRLRCSN